jgi:hypothetical protein
MYTFIPLEVQDDELLVRFITLRHIKSKKQVLKENIDYQSIFLDKRGVSLQRGNFCSELECKERALQIPAPNSYIGFVVFKKKQFIDLRNEFLKIRKSFDADIRPSPLNIKLQYLIYSSNILKEWEGNPSHADLFFIDPGVIVDESPNTVIRSFSKKLTDKCSIFLDEEPEKLEIVPCTFKAFQEV